ncbi:ASKHA domain-containing protein [Geomesophilobacter sediminis]|uniref:DUF4445 domain-containing protein n=1 Tax=Geomesophilobacter sediminis TaxID=2798584 RepID=A0A8J7J907_9BACT|nr:ASKHA domain-containing protein [Geomesophilobacter sediminis]MBJ6726236.1 DUF4445 domain-containing protein [Geomesophilobacter sediminis]
MPLITFSSLDLAVEVPVGTTLLEAARHLGIPLEAPCSGAATCGKCAVQLEPGSLSNVAGGGLHRLSPGDEARGMVLSCTAAVTGDVAVRDLPRPASASLKVLDRGVGSAVELDPFLSKVYDAENRLTRIRAGADEVGVEPGDTRQKFYGVVVDIGTTTLAVSLTDLGTGAEIASAGTLNPQSRHAQDVLSRIRLASRPEGLQEMHVILIEAIAGLICQLAGEAKVDPAAVYEVVFSGNTGMLHLAVAENPASLGKYPFLPVVRGNEYRSAHRLNLPVAPCAPVYLPPVISGYVGADITCGIVATGLHRDPGVTLLIDIGTNGEMVIGCRGRLYATSTAAGPAFEGMNISCGMRASAGAVEAVTIDASGGVALTTVAGAEPVGICGSGLIDLVALLVSCGIIGANGRLLEPADLPSGLTARLEQTEGKTSFRLTERVHLTQKDVRQVQLAKGAVRAGIELLLQSLDIEAQEVGRVLIAGSFGYHLRAESLLVIGLLPHEFAGKVEFVGNTAKSGGEALLKSRAAREEIAEVVCGIEVVELANHADFDRCFVESLKFPSAGAAEHGSRHR